MSGKIDKRIACLASVRLMTIEDGGHMLHYDQPQLLILTIEQFLAL
ncbi:MAG: alpha/beta hydrolase [Glaciimonas sp.]|nr:alpha/beta hydrolase [Glaciimonas sp.]